jgi:hypothetical protein
MSNPSSSNRRYDGSMIPLIVIVLALAFTFVTIWVLIFRFTPSTISDVQREKSFYSNDASKLLIPLPQSSVPSVQNALSKQEGQRAVD